MNKSFMLFDKNNNLQKNANIIVKFNFLEKEYLIYSIDENEQNSQIFVSRLVLNSEGKIFVDNIMPDEKGKLNNIVYNIVILLPSDSMKGVSFENLTAGLFDKFAVKLSLDIPELAMQEYYPSCSVAITSKILVDSAVKLYNDNLNKPVVEEVPVWTAPVSVTSPVPAVPEVNNGSDRNNITNAVDGPIVPVLDPVVNSEINIQPANVNMGNSIPTPAPDGVTPSHILQNETDLVLPNPQKEKLAIVSDPSLGIGVTQPNVVKNKKAGFASTKYVIIGTVCLIFSVAVVIIAYILISNMK